MSVNNTLKNDLDDAWKVIEMNEMAGLQVKYIREITSRLGIKHSQDTDTIVPRERVEAMVDWMMMNREEMNTVFDMKDRGDGDKFRDKIRFKKTVELIQKLLRRWSMSEFKPLTKDRTRTTMEYKIYISNPTLALVWDSMKQL